MLKLNNLGTNLNREVDNYDMNNEVTATLMIFLSAALYGPGPAFARKILLTTDPFIFLLITSTLAAGIFFIVYFVKFKRLPKFSKKDIRPLISIAIIAGFVRLLFFYALNYTLVKNVAFISPVASNIFILLMASIFLKETINRRLIVGGLIGLTGSILIATNGMINLPSFGDYLVIIAMFLESIRVIILKHFLKKKNVYDMTFVSVVGAGVTILLLSLLFLQTPLQMVEFDLSTILIYAYIIVVAMIFGKSLYLAGLEKVRAYHTNILYTIFSPVMTAFFGFLILGETFVFHDLLGGALAIIGILVINWDSFRLKKID